MFLNIFKGTFYGDGLLFLLITVLILQFFLESLLSYEPSWLSSTLIMKTSVSMIFL